MPKKPKPRGGARMRKPKEYVLGKGRISFRGDYMALLYGMKSWKEKKLCHTLGLFAQRGTLLFRPDPPKPRRKR